MLHESCDRVLDDRVNLCLSHDCDSRTFVLSRELVRSDGAKFGQLIEANAATALYDSATSDPYAARLRARYDAVIHLVGAAEPRSETERWDIAGTIGAIDRIANCRSEGEVLVLVSSIVRSLGAMQFICQWLTFEPVSSPDADALESRYLVGCRPSWVQRHIAKLWYMNDPLVSYARSNAVPALSSQINLRRKDHWLVTEARSQGSLNGLVAPAHLPGSDLMGLLYVSNNELPTTGDAKLWR